MLENQWLSLVRPPNGLAQILFNCFDNANQLIPDLWISIKMIVKYCRVFIRGVMD
jgi:hypothetical protein